MAQPRGSFIPTTDIWDPDEILQAEGVSDDLKEILVRMYQNLGRMATNVNLKDTGYYALDSQFITGKNFFATPGNKDQNDFRAGLRAVVDFGALPAAGTKSVAHNIDITSAYTATLITAASTDPTGLTWIPIPFVHATDPTQNLQLDVDATNVNITTGGFDYSSYTRCIVVIEYLVR